MRASGRPMAVRSAVRGHSRRADLLLVVLVAVACGRSPASPPSRQEWSITYEVRP
jgi:hypothetical protein